MKNKIIIVIFILLAYIVSCTGNEIESSMCGDYDNYIDCLRANNNRVPAFYTDFAMLYRSNAEDQTLDGVAYIDSVTKRYCVELSTVDIMMFKGVIKDDEIKIMFRTDTDKFEGIIANLSEFDLNDYTTLDFDINSILRILSLKIPVFDEYETISKDSDSEKTYELIKENKKDILKFAETYPMVENLYRGVYEKGGELTNANLKMAYQYKYPVRAYKEEIFNDLKFFFPRKTVLKYYPLENGEILKKEIKEIHIGINDIRFEQSISDSNFDFDFPNDIKIHDERFR